MMQIVYFSKKSEILEYLKDNSKERVFVTPSPLKADGLRGMISDWTKTDVLTIAKFTSDLLKLHQPEEIDKVKRKSDLLLVFGFLKNKYLPDLGYEQFNQAYNLFSDLRSFTLHEEALKSVLDEQPAEIQNAISLFWKLLEVTGFLDEHGAYEKIAQSLRSAEDEPELHKTYIFWGFQNLNGQQVDLLKALSIRYQVIIPFPFSLKDKLKRSDWISWLADYKVEEVELAKSDQSAKAEWIEINSREVASTLKHLLRDDDQVILGVSKIQSQHMGVLPSTEVNFKISHQLIQTEINEFFDELNSSLNENLFLDSLSSLILLKKKTLIENKTATRYFKKLKTIQLYEEALSTIQNLSDDNIKVDHFFLRLIKDVVSLNQPRTSFAPIAKNELRISLKDMSSLEEVETDKRVILCIDDRYDDIQSLGQNYTESIQKSLSALGPLKRNELELQFKKWEFQELLSEASVTVLMSSTTLKHNLIWKNIFQNIDLNKLDTVFKKTPRPIKDYFASHIEGKFSGSFSASKFTAFIDCPRKFYLNYISNIVPRLVFENDFDASVLGTLAHKVIEQFIKENRNDSELQSICIDVIQNYIKNNQIELEEQNLQARTLLILHRSRSGIDLLKKIESVIPETITWNIEERINLDEPFSLKGSIDCVGVSKSHIFLIDFKSTKSSASTFSQIEKFESLQLWVYAYGISKKIEGFSNKEVTIGYVTLEEQKKSNFLCSSEEVKDLLKPFCSTAIFKDSFKESLDKSVQIMTTLAETIYSETTFPVKPLSPDVCRYCEVNRVCHKGELR